MSGVEDVLVAAMFDGCRDALVVMTPAGMITRWNAAAERLYAITTQEALGQSVAMLPGGDDILQHTIAAASGHSSSFDAEHVGREGRKVEVTATVCPVLDDTGAVIAVWCAARDVTEDKDAEREFVRLAEAAEYGTDAVVSMDFDGVVRHWNRGAERLLGLSAQEAIGKSFVEVNALTGQPEEANERARELIERIRCGEPAYHVEARRRRTDGGLSDVLVTVTPWHVDGRLAGVTTTALDITERARVEQATARLAAIVDASDDAIIGKTLDGKITSWNPAAVHIFGYSAAEAVGQPVSMLAPGCEDEMAGLLASVARGERVSHLQSTRRRRDGRDIDVSVTVSPIRDRQGEIVGAATVIRDITERKRAERELERLAQAAEHSSDSVMSFDLDGRIRHFNPGAERISGFSAQEMIGLSIAEWGALSGEGDELTRQLSPLLDRALAGEVVRYETQRRRKDGTVIDLQATLTPWRSDGQVVGVTSTASDITERKAAERELERLAQAAEHGSDVVASYDPEGRICHWNAGAEAAFGFSADEMIGRTWADLNALTGDSEEGDRRVSGAFARALAGEVVRYEAHRRHKGAELDLQVTLMPWRVDGRTVGVISTAFDITERKRAEALLHESQSRLQSILDHAPAGIYLMDLDGRFVVINDELERILGVPRDQALGQVREQVLPADVAAQHRANDLEVLRRGQAVRFEETAPRADGERIYQSVKFPLRGSEGRVYGIGGISTDVTDQRTAERARTRALADLEDAQRVARVGSWSWDPGSEQVSWSAQMYAIFGRDPANGPPSIGEFLTYAHPDDRERVAAAYAQAHGGQAMLELESRTGPGAGAGRTVHILAHEDPAHPGCYLGTVQDVTRQRRAERERLELLQASARAESANRAKSEFLARMSHELRTPLNSIIGFSQLLQLGELPPRQSQDIGHILTAGNHLLALVNEVLDLARIESGQMTISPEPVAVKATIEAALTLVAPLAVERNVSLAINTDGLAHDGHVHADRHRFQQVLLNLLSNAIKYNRPGGRVDISFNITPAARVRTTIADTGIGIPAEQLPKLFEPFERLGAERTDIEGTGLGLALSQGLIESMGGTIAVESTLGVGTRFVIELAAAERPTAEHEPGPIGQLAELGRPDAGRHLILYIEDNLSNLTLVERILEPRLNVELISAMQGRIGLDLARQCHPDVIVLDLHLPDIQGAEVLTRLKADPLTRKTPVIVLTADASGRQAQRVKQLGAIDYLTKPIDVPRFLEIIARNLADPPGTPAVGNQSRA